MSSVSIIGLGKLGSCMAAVYASKGHEVFGFDLQGAHVAAIAEAKPPVVETDLAATLSQGRPRLHGTASVQEAVDRSSLTFIIVPTPSEPEGHFSLDSVRQACHDVGKALRGKKDYHLVVLTSTVLPKNCEEKIIPVLEQTSGKTCGKDFGFCYSPLFIAIGSVIRNLRRPDFFLVGQADVRSGDTLEAFYQTVCDALVPVRRMSLPSAELTKIAVNSYVTMKITFANMLGEIAEKIPGVNIDEVTDALGSDARIGAMYLKSGLGYGGPCFPRDNRAFAHMARERGVDAPFASKTDAYNKTLMHYWTDKIKTLASPSDVIAVIGTSYKPGTAFAEESQAIGIIQILLKDGFTVCIHNPDGNEDTRKRLGDSVTYYEDLAACLKRATIVFLGLPVKENSALECLRQQRAVRIIDPWRQLASRL
ncbi:nucleotide sugar dehydrogenase [Candidatus Uhrbacteria bacterium]|nr:nucleotide sugar dehydrogenase [Candidatus Uhrbacteria bacterium]